MLVECDDGYGIVIFDVDFGYVALMLEPLFPLLLLVLVERPPPDFDALFASELLGTPSDEHDMRR